MPDNAQSSIGKGIKKVWICFNSSFLWSGHWNWTFLLREHDFGFVRFVQVQLTEGRTARDTRPSSYHPKKTTVISGTSDASTSQPSHKQIPAQSKFLSSDPLAPVKGEGSECGPPLRILWQVRRWQDRPEVGGVSSGREPSMGLPKVFKMLALPFDSIKSVHAFWRVADSLWFPAA